MVESRRPLQTRSAVNCLPGGPFPTNRPWSWSWPNQLLKQSLADAVRGQQKGKLSQLVLDHLSLKDVTSHTAPTISMEVLDHKHAHHDVTRSANVGTGLFRISRLCEAKTKRGQRDDLTVLRWVNLSSVSRSMLARIFRIRSAGCQAVHGRNLRGQHDFIRHQRGSDQCTSMKSDATFRRNTHILNHVRGLSTSEWWAALATA